jgi:ferredoxin
MTFVIVEPCIGSKDSSCVEVCPVDCIHPTPDEEGYAEVEHLFIDAEECIDCNACAQICPVEACLAEEEVPEKWSSFIAANRKYFDE